MHVHRVATKQLGVGYVGLTSMHPYLRFHECPEGKPFPLRARAMVILCFGPNGVMRKLEDWLIDEVKARFGPKCLTNYFGKGGAGVAKHLDRCIYLYLTFGT